MRKDKEIVNTPRRRIYAVSALVPVSTRGDMWPLNWNERSFYKKEKFGYNSIDFEVPADSFHEAHSRLTEEIRKTFGNLRPAPYFHAFGDKFGERDWNGELREKGVAKTVEENGFHYHGIKSCLRSDLVAVEKSEQPLYLLEGFDIQGILISYEEIERMVNKGILPKIFVSYPKLIPRNNNWPDENPYLETEPDFYNGENLTDRKQREIAQKLLENEPDNRDSERGRKCYYHAFRTIKVNTETPDRFFVNELDFFIYNPRGFKNQMIDRFMPRTFSRGVSRYSGLIYLNPKSYIGTKEEVECRVRKMTKDLIRFNQGGILSLKRNLPKRLEIIANLPDLK